MYSNSIEFPHFGISQAKSLFIGAALFFLAIILNFEIARFESVWIELPLTQEEKWNPKLFETISFGHLAPVVDWLWLESLQDPALFHVAPGTHPPVYFDIDLATDLDPAYFIAYISGADLVSVVRGDGPGARDLLLKAERFEKADLPHYPERFKNIIWHPGWAISLTLAYVYLFDLDDLAKAGEQFVAASNQPGAPIYLANLAERLKKTDGVYEVGLKLLAYKIQGSKDERMTDSLMHKRENLFVSQYLFNIRSDFQKFLDKQPGYRSSVQLAPGQIETYWLGFKRQTNLTGADPWGGKLTIGSDGRIQTTTTHEKVFGLD